MEKLSMDSAELGKRLAKRHRGSAVLDPTCCLLNYAEISYEGDWTLRSALMRLAQPHPVRVGSILDLSRRLDAPLQHVRRELERQIVVTDRALDPDGLDGPPVMPCPDIRTADLARLVAAGADQDQLVSGYLAGSVSADQEANELQHEELLALPLLAIAVSFEQLGATLAGWALIGPDNPPVEAIDSLVETVLNKLDELGVPAETGPPPGMRRGTRS